MERKYQKCGAVVDEGDTFCTNCGERYAETALGEPAIDKNDAGMAAYPAGQPVADEDEGRKESAQSSAAYSASQAAISENKAAKKSFNALLIFNMLIFAVIAVALYYMYTHPNADKTAASSNTNSSYNTNTSGSRASNRTNTGNASAAASIPVVSLQYFGYYEQDNNYANGLEPIEWIVLKVDGNKALLISAKILDGVKYNDRSGNVTWSGCSLRSWLNNTFYYNAFSETDRQYIYSTNNEGASDLVFILSANEARSIAVGGGYSWRKGVATEYAKSTGLYYDDVNSASWWLRTAQSTDSIPWVYANGSQVEDSGEPANGTSGWGGARNGVRPAIWVDIGAFK